MQMTVVKKLPLLVGFYASPFAGRHGYNGGRPQDHQGCGALKRSQIESQV
jgi:hypothetical protein